MTFVEKDKKRLSPYGGVLLLSKRPIAHFLRGKFEKKVTKSSRAHIGITTVCGKVIDTFVQNICWMNNMPTGVEWGAVDKSL
jgi:hypothetical protein